MKVKLGTRDSELALWQTNWVMQQLQEKHPGIEFELLKIKTTGDKILNSPLSKIGDKGLFTRELDNALLNGRIDLAVHSMKDVPTRFDESIIIGAVTTRWDPSDVLISRDNIILEQLPHRARIATGSLRRQAQLRHFRTDFEIADIRGNLNTRLRKFDDADWDGMILAAAGLERLQMNERITQKLPFDIMLPAVGQGCFAVMTQRDNQPVQALLNGIHNPDAATAVYAERAFLRTLEGGCQVPIGALAVVDDDEIHLRGCVVSLDGKISFRDRISAPANQNETAGIRLAEGLLQAGAGRVLDEIRNQNSNIQSGGNDS